MTAAELTVKRVRQWCRIRLVPASLRILFHGTPWKVDENWSGREEPPEDGRPFALVLAAPAGSYLTYDQHAHIFRNVPGGGMCPWDVGVYIRVGTGAPGTFGSSVLFAYNDYSRELLAGILMRQSRDLRTDGGGSL